MTDFFPINSQAAERLGYPTQKPLALLERIILASSNPGDVVQVKGGKPGVSQIRDLRGVMARDKAQLGFFICLEEPTKQMRDEARAAGTYTPLSGVGRKVDVLQIRTIGDLLGGDAFEFPVYRSNVTYKQAQAHAAAHQSAMDL